MSEKDIDMNGEQLDEFQSSYGDPSSVPEPVNKKAKAPGK